MLFSLLVLCLALLCAWLLARHFPEKCTQLSMGLARSLLGLQEHSIDIGGLRICYLDGGKGEPLVLLHGMGADKDNFLPIVPWLKASHRLVIPDLPGFGDSGRRGDGDYSVAQQVASLHAFAQRLGMPRFHLGGNSMGGFIAAAHAKQHPESVASLWLLDPAGVRGGRHSELTRTLIAGGEPQILARSESEFRAALRFVSYRQVPMPGFLIRTYAARHVRDHDHYLRICRQLVEGQWLDELLVGGLDVATLILWGEADRAVDPSGAQVLKQLIPAAELVMLPRTGHLPHAERPRLTARHYLAFRRRLSPG